MRFTTCWRCQGPYFMTSHVEQRGCRVSWRKTENRMGWHVSASEAWHISRKKHSFAFDETIVIQLCVFWKTCDQDDVRQCKMFQVSSPLNSRVTSILGHELPEEPVILWKFSNSQGFDPYPYDFRWKGTYWKAPDGSFCVLDILVELCWTNLEEINKLVGTLESKIVNFCWLIQEGQRLTLPMELWSLFWRAPPMGNIYFCGMGGLCMWYSMISWYQWYPLRSNIFNP